MPKRIPTPPPGDDEPRYLTVVHPYAISGTCNMELPKDRQDFARWVACCVDKDAFFAIFHKPSSRGMVIIEINRDYPHFDRVLGEHRWSEFLQSPSKDEKDRVTQVFYCTYNTGRIVQKNGWKRIDVDEAWFRAWSPKNRQIKFPYPQTHFCDIPFEDRTNHSLCRPLPGAIITPPPVEIAAPQPVVGSAAWIQKKEGGPSLDPIPTQNKPNTLGAWGKRAPKLQATAAKLPTANGNVKKTATIPQGPPTSTRMPAVGGGPIAVKSSDVWQNTRKKPGSTPVMTNWDESPPVSRQSTPVSPVITPVTTNQAPVAPPGLPARKNASGSGATSCPTTLAVPGKPAVSVAQSGPDRATNMSWGSAGASTSSPDSDSGPDLTTATESDNPYAVHIHFSESMEEEFHGMGIRDLEDEGELRELDSIAPVWDEPTGPAAWEANPSGWGDEPVDAEDLWRQNRETVKPVLCNAHGIICKKGICAEYARQLRLAKRADEAEKRKAALANKGKKGNRAKGRAAAKKNENESANKNTAQNNNQFRVLGAPVKTNWRGAPRAIVSADTIEQRETTKGASDDGWGNSDSEGGPNTSVTGPADAASAASWGVPENDPWVENEPSAASWGVPENENLAANAPSAASWGVSENAYDPWATPGMPATKANPSDSKPRGTVSSSWADQVDAELGSGGASTFSVVSSKRGGRRGKPTAGWRTNATSSTPKWSTNG